MPAIGCSDSTGLGELARRCGWSICSQGYLCLHPCHLFGAGSHLPIEDGDAQLSQQLPHYFAGRHTQPKQIVPVQVRAAQAERVQVVFELRAGRRIADEGKLKGAGLVAMQQCIEVAIGEWGVQRRQQGLKCV